MRKVSLPGKDKGSMKPANFHSSSLLYTNEEIFAIDMEELKLIEEKLAASKEVGKKIVEVSIFVSIKS